MTAALKSTSPASQSSAPKSTKDGKRKRKRERSEPRPSSSLVLLSPTNQVLLLHRVQTSSAFPSAHVFPGGNLSEYHDGAVPTPSDPARHVDGLAYRLGALRETFEESGILLAREKGGNGRMLTVPAAERDAARKRIYGNEVRFGEWLDSVGGVADTDNLYPFTRWITPPASAKRFTTQMYLYLLPLYSSASSSSTSDPALLAAQSEAVLPTPDGTEVTTCMFDNAATWLERQKRGDIILFPPQAFLLSLVARFCTGPPPTDTSPHNAPESHYQAQREALLDFLRTTPTSTKPAAAKHPTSRIPWADKVISPVATLIPGDGRVVLALDKVPPELEGSGRGGDYERVALVNFTKAGPRDVEIRDREEVFEEARREKEEDATGGAKL